MVKENDNDRPSYYYFAYHRNGRVPFDYFYHRYDLRILGENFGAVIK